MDSPGSVNQATRPGSRSVWFLIAGMLIALSICTFGYWQGRSRVLSRSTDAAGNSVVWSADPRLFGLMGIEITQCTYAPDGRKLSGSVHDLLGTWHEVERRYGAGKPMPAQPDEPQRP
ncbi:MAG: hypothetical protein R3B90_16840 [Planctomycetaceae bacterium]